MKPRKSETFDEEHNHDAFQSVVLENTKETIEQNMIRATASVFASLNEQQKNKLDNFDKLKKLHDDAQQIELQSYLISQKISPESNAVMNEVRKWSIDLYKEIDIDKIKFAFVGPRLSGKTTMLFTAASTLSRKLQISNMASKYLFFPINFDKQSSYLENPFSLMELFLKVSFDSLEFSNFANLPYIQQIKKWFMLTVHGGQVMFPKINVPNFDLSKIKELAKNLHLSQKDNETNNIEKYLQTIIKFPREFAKATGFNDVIYIFDSLEMCNIKYSPSDECFSSTNKSAVLSDLIGKEISRSIFLVACKNEEQFHQFIKIKNAKIINSKNLVNVSLPYSIKLENPNIKFNVKDCMGCIGYIDKFYKICDLIKANKIYQNKNLEFIHKAEISRNNLIKRELKNLFEKLLNSGSNIINNSILTEISNLETISKYSLETEYNEGDNKLEEEEEKKENKLEEEEKKENKLEEEEKKENKLEEEEKQENKLEEEEKKENKLEEEEKKENKLEEEEEEKKENKLEEEGKQENKLEEEDLFKKNKLQFFK